MSDPSDSPSTKPAARDCAVFLTHKWSPAIARHYERFRKEAGAAIDVVLAFHQNDGKTVPAGMVPDLVITSEVARALQPHRFAEYIAAGRPTIYGFVDLIWLAAFLDPSLAAYNRFWLVEFDVDFAGDWGDFFREAAGFEGDILAAHIVSRSKSKGFRHWPTYVQPADGPADPLHGFFPISRFSRPALLAIKQELSAPGWQGHFELLYPSIALARGFTVADIGGVGEFTPPARRTRFYGRTGTRSNTHGFRPPRAYDYFGDRPRGFRNAGAIYHPVKPDTSWPDRFRFERREFAKWLFRRWPSLRGLLGYDVNATRRKT